MFFSPVRFTVLGAVLVTAAQSAAAQRFTARDAETGIVMPSASATPNTWNARQRMLAALGTSSINTNTFESLGLGQISDLGGGVSATYDQVIGGVTVNASTEGSRFGFNTTAGGGQYLRMTPNVTSELTSITLTFATPINFFGGYFTGVETGCGQTRVFWGAEEFRLLNTVFPNACTEPEAGIQWFGIISTESFSSLTIRQVSARSPNFEDRLGLDDMIYGTTTTVVPEPATYAMLASGLALIAAMRRRR